MTAQDPKVTVLDPIDGIRVVVRDGPVKTAATSLAPCYAGWGGRKDLALSVASDAVRRCACYGMKIGLTLFANIECPHAMTRRETDGETCCCRQTDWVSPIFPMAASYLVGAVIRQTSTSRKGYKMIEKNVKQWLAILKKAGLHIDPETAEIDRNYAQTLDPYGVYPDLPGFWLDAMAIERAAEQNCYFGNPPANCDLCERAFAQEKYFVDGRVRGVGACGFMCVDCFGEHGVGLGLGIGQLYRRERDGRWLLVERPIIKCHILKNPDVLVILHESGSAVYASLPKELPWLASIDEPMHIELGHFATEREAALAHDRAVILLYGEDAETNFPLEESEYVVLSDEAMRQINAVKAGRGRLH